MDPTNNMNHALEHVNVQQAPPHPPHQVVDAEDGGIHVVDHADVQAMMLDHPNSVNTMNHGVPPHHHQQQHHAAAAAATLQQHEEDDPAATNDPAEAERRRHRLAAQSIAAEAAANHKRRMEEQAAIDHLNEQLGEVGEESFHPKRKRSIRTYLQKKDRTRPPPEDLVSAWKTYETVRTEYDRLLAVTKIKEKKVQDAQAVVAQAQQELLQCHQEADLYQQTQVVKAKETVARLELEYHDSAWNAMFRKLEDYHAQHGNVDLPLRSKEDPELDKLCVWVTRQRSRKVDHDKKVREGKYKKKRHIGLERKEYQFDMLEKLGVRWSRKQDNWLARYDDLLKFKQEFGHCNGKYLLRSSLLSFHVPVSVFAHHCTYFTVVLHIPHTYLSAF